METGVLLGFNSLKALENKKGDLGVSGSTWGWSAALCPPGWGPGGARSVPRHRVWVSLCSSDRGFLLAASSQGLLFNNHFNSYLHSTVLAASLLSLPGRWIPARPLRRPPALPIAVCGQEVGRGWGCAPQIPLGAPIPHGQGWEHTPCHGSAAQFPSPSVPHPIKPHRGHQGGS